MLKLPIYLDHHATTPADPRVVEAMLPYFSDRFGNSASRHHSFGWAARDAVATARRQIASLIGCDPGELFFTSGATESNNLALKGVAHAVGVGAAHIVTVATEHRAVLDPCRRLEEEGARVTVIQPRPDGLVDLTAIERALTPDTTLLSVMTANNEIGVVQPIAEIGRIARAGGVLFHTDAAQAVGKLPLAVDDLCVDLVSLSAHKLYGPKGVGVLYVRRTRPRIALRPLLDGGGHEGGLRSGTINVPAVVGFGRAAEICDEEMAAEHARTQALRDRLLAGLERRLGGIHVNGSMNHRLPHNLNVSVSGLAGSRCSSASTTSPFRPGQPVPPPIPSRHMCCARSACLTTCHARRFALASADGRRPKRSTTWSRR